MKQYVLNTTTYGTYAHSHEVLLVAGEGFEPSKAEPGIYSPLPLAARATRQGLLSEVKSKALVVVMPKVQLFITVARNKSNMIRI